METPNVRRGHGNRIREWPENVDIARLCRLLWVLILGRQGHRKKRKSGGRKLGGGTSR